MQVRDDIIQGEISTGLFKQRNQHYCFYALLLPVPERHNTLISDIKSGVFESYVEIENLLPDEILKSNELVEEKSILGNKYLKIKENVKSNIDKVLCGLKREDFNDFIPLFEKIDNLFNPI